MIKMFRSYCHRTHASTDAIGHWTFVGCKQLRVICLPQLSLQRVVFWYPTIMITNRVANNCFYYLCNYYWIGFQGLPKSSGWMRDPKMTTILWPLVDHSRSGALKIDGESPAMLKLRAVYWDLRGIQRCFWQGTIQGCSMVRCGCAFCGAQLPWRCERWWWLVGFLQLEHHWRSNWSIIFYNVGWCSFSKIHEDSWSIIGEATSR